MSAAFKVCPCCSKEYDAHQWAALPYVGEQVTEDEVSTYRLELRNCTCGSTIGIERSTSKVG